MVWRCLHHKEIHVLLSEPGRDRRECIYSRTSPLRMNLTPGRFRGFVAQRPCTFKSVNQLYDLHIELDLNWIASCFHGAYCGYKYTGPCMLNRICGLYNNYDYRWMVMLDFICMGSAKLFGSGRERKIQNENERLQRDSNPRHATPRQVNQRFRPLGNDALMTICRLKAHNLPISVSKTKTRNFFYNYYL